MRQTHLVPTLATRPPCCGSGSKDWKNKKEPKKPFLGKELKKKLCHGATPSVFQKRVIVQHVLWARRVGPGIDYWSVVVEPGCILPHHLLLVDLFVANGCQKFEPVAHFCLSVLFVAAPEFLGRHCGTRAHLSCVVRSKSTPTIFVPSSVSYCVCVCAFVHVCMCVNVGLPHACFPP